jgi:hypothetical protein
VQQQVALTVKLYFAVNLIDGNLDDPQIPDAVVRKLGKDSHYRAQVGGRSYNVVERHYALTADNSGALTIPAIVFRGHAADGNAGGFFFNQGRAIGAQSPTIELNVRPRPANSGTDAWLPARSMSLVATGIDATTRATAGEPLTLDLRLEAQGLGFEQLPKLVLPKIAGADVYPDKPVTQDKNDDQWLYGVRERKFAIVPNRPGTLELPPISIQWWDTAHDRAQTTTVPALQLQVLPAAASASSGMATVPVGVTGSASASNLVPPLPNTGSGNVVSAPGELATWRTLAFVSMALWVLTLIAWIAWLVGQRRAAARAIPAPAPDSTSAKRAFADACARQDWTMASRSLLRWARQTLPQVRNLGELAQRVGDPAQRAAIEKLERIRFGQAVEPRLGAELTASFRRGPLWVQGDGASPRNTVLPELYPKT